jgi:hypothetical protein
MRTASSNHPLTSCIIAALCGLATVVANAVLCG